MTDPWCLVFEGYDPEDEGRREALCALGNGYFATRGSAPECHADDHHYPGTYLAGGYDRLESEVAGRKVENEDLVNLPNWTSVAFQMPDGRQFHPQAYDLLDYRQELDLRRGVLERTVRFEDPDGRRTRFVTRRFVHMRHPHLAAQACTWVAENWSGSIQVDATLDGTVVNAGVERYRGLSSKHLRGLGGGNVDKETVLLKTQMRQSEIRVAMAARVRVFQEGLLLPVPRSSFGGRERAGHTLDLPLQEGKAVTLESVVALYTSRDAACSQPGLDARRAVVGAPDVEGLLEGHVLDWRHLWERFDTRPSNRESTAGAQMQQAVRLHLFHLIQTTSPHTIDLDVGVPARGWSGEAYRGHVFWDEIFIFPTVTLRIPEITRGLLKYRYRRLEPARQAARDAGFRGAMYPWQSGSEGREETQKVHLNPRSGRWLPDHSHLQRHVNAAIAYNVWHYWQVTGDMEFLCFYGAEMFLEIARFWASLCSRDGDRCVIRGVMGPDEYHDMIPGRDRPGVDNNAYTNLMAAWVLWRTEAIIAGLPDDRRTELLETLHVTEEERREWEEHSRRLYVPVRDGIIEQFEGYFDLEEFDWDGYRRRYGNIQRLDRILEAEGDTPNRYQLSKQADVLMLFYLFDDDELRALLERLGMSWDEDMRARNVAYYTARSSHGSTLSQSVHSWVLADSSPERSWDLFLEALRSDLGDVQGGTTREGIHLGAMASTVDLLQRRYAGIAVRDDVLCIDPHLPPGLSGLEIHTRFRGHFLDLHIDRRTVRIHAYPSPAAPVKIRVMGQEETLSTGVEKEWAR